MVIRSADSGVLIDLAVNAPPDLPASATPAGPTLAPEELAGNKLLALFDRAAARDFADIYILARRFGKNVLLARAAQIDAGFDVRVLADMIATLDRFTDSEIPVPTARPRPNCERSTRTGDRSSQHKPGSAGPRLIQQTAGQTLRAHFWHPFRSRREPLPGTQDGSPTATVSSPVSQVGPWRPLSLPAICFTALAFLRLCWARHAGAWGIRELAGVGEAEAGVAGCALGQ
jgi:hypothetical protein